MSKTFSQLRQELNEAELLPLLTSKGIAPANNNMPSAKSTAVGRPLPTQKTLPSGEKITGGKTIRSPQLSAPKPDAGWGNYKAPKVKPTTIGDVGKSAARAAGRVASKVAKPVGALAGGFEAGKMLNKIPAVSNVTDKIGKAIANKISPPKEVIKARSGNAKISQSALGSALRNEPQTLKVPETNKPQKTFNVDISKKSPLPKEAPNKVTPKGKVTNEPMRKSAGGNPKVIPKGIAPKMTSKVAPKPAMKSIPTRKPSADPNAGGGFVTARAYGSKSAGITSTQNRFGGSKGQSFMKPTPQGRIKPAETQSQKDSRLASQGFKKM